MRLIIHTVVETHTRSPSIKLTRVRCTGRLHPYHHWFRGTMPLWLCSIFFRSSIELVPTRKDTPGFIMSTIQQSILMRLPIVSWKHVFSFHTFEIDNNHLSEVGTRQICTTFRDSIPPFSGFFQVGSGPWNRSGIGEIMKNGLKHVHIRLSEGSYHNNANAALNFCGHSATIIGAGMGKTTLTGTLVIEGGNLFFQNITFTVKTWTSGSMQGCTSGAGLNVCGENAVVHVDSCEFTGIIGGTAVLVTQSARAFLVNCHIHHNSSAAVIVQGHSGSDEDWESFGWDVAAKARHYSRYTATANLTNCHIHHNYQTAIVAEINGKIEIMGSRTEIHHNEHEAVRTDAGETDGESTSSVIGGFPSSLNSKIFHDNEWTSTTTNIYRATSALHFHFVNHPSHKSSFENQMYRYIYMQNATATGTRHCKQCAIELSRYTERNVE